MQKKNLKMVITWLAILFVSLVLINLISGGSSPKDKFEDERAELKSDLEKLDKLSAKVDSDAKDENTAFSRAVHSMESYTALNLQRDQYRTFLEKLEKPELLEKAKDEEILSLTDQSRALRAGTDDIVTRVDKDIQDLERVSKNPDKILTEAKDIYTSLEHPGGSELEALVSKASTDWPEKKSVLNSQLEALKEIHTQATPAYETVVEEVAKDEDMDLRKTFVAHQKLKNFITTKNEGAKNLRSLVDQLYYSMDKILIDMDEEGTGSYFHEIKTVQIFQDGRQETSTIRRPVSSSEYKRHSEHLGMTISSKPLGKFESEATEYVSPPGYNYVGNDRYGHWRTDNRGNRFWEFYGQYSFMRNLFWGPSYYNPIGYSDWNSYSTYRRSGRTYYGGTGPSSRKYGTSGSFTRTKYAGSRYSQKKYSSSGYGGSKYGSGSRSSGSSYGSGSRSSGSSYGSGSRSSGSSYGSGSGYRSGSSYRGYSSGGSRSSFGK